MSSPSPANQAAILVFGRVLASLSEALILVVIVRLVGKIDVGNLTEILLVYSTLEMAVTGGMPATLTYFLPNRSVEQRRAIAWRVCGILLLFGLGTGLLLLGVGLAALWQPAYFSEHLSYFALLAPFPLGDVPYHMLPNLLVLEGRSQAAAKVGVVRSLAMTVATIVPLAFGASLWVVMISLSLCGIVFAAITRLWLRRLYLNVPGIVCPVSRRKLLRFGLPLGMTEIVANVSSRFDRFLIALFFSQAAYAEYQAGSWQIPLIPSIAYAVGVAYGPVLARLHQERRGEEAIRIWREQARKTALLVVPVALIFVVAAEETIEVLFTSSYLAAAWVFRCYAAMTACRITAFGTMLVSAGKPQYVVRASLIALASNAVISTLLLLLLGFYGPALGTLLAFLPMAWAYCYYISRVCGVSVRQTWPLREYLKVLALAGVAAVPALAFKLAVDLPAAWKLAGEAGLLLAAFSVLGTKVGLIESADWRFVRDWIWPRAAPASSAATPPRSP